MNHDAKRSALITGAGSGIGKDVAKLLYDRGWQLGLLDVQDSALAELVEQWDPFRFRQYHADVSDAEAVSRAVNDFGGNAGRLDFLFNCAGVLSVGDFESIELARHHQIIDINNQGVLNCCYCAFPYLRDTAGAKVINMSSASSLIGVPGFASYSASKFWVKGFTEALNLEWARYDITVMDIEPPFVKTPMLQTQSSPIIDRLGVNLQPEDVAIAVLRALDTSMVHHPVSLEYKALRLASKLVPSSVSRQLMKRLSGY